MKKQNKNTNKQNKLERNVKKILIRETNGRDKHLHNNKNGGDKPDWFKILNKKPCNPKL